MAFEPFYVREFLNEPRFHAGAYIHGSVEIDAGGSPFAGGADDPWIVAELTIADCNRSARLDFDCTTPGATRNALYKARLLRDTVSAFVTALESAVAEEGLR